MLTLEQISEIDRFRAELREKFRNTPESGLTIEYLGKQFMVYKNVFWPHDDSEGLALNMKINPGEAVLDACTGSGNIGIFAAYKGAARVVSFDISPDNIRAARHNVQMHGFSGIIDIRQSDMFSSIRDSEGFDVITCNPPFTVRPAADLVEGFMFDTGFHVHKELIKGAQKHLRPNGRMYVSQSNFGAARELKRLAVESGFAIRKINERSLSHSRIIYVFELKRESIITF
jgi:release factor glutamine methyltransferase